MKEEHPHGCPSSCMFHHFPRNIIYYITKTTNLKQNMNDLYQLSLKTIFTFTFKTSSEDDAKVQMCAHTDKFSCKFYTKKCIFLI